MSIQKPSTQPTPGKISKPVKPKRWVIAIVVVAFIGVGVLGWYYFYGPCGVSRVEKASVELTSIIDRFRDADNVAAGTARTSLDEPIVNLQEISGDLNKVEVPACLASSKTYLANGMERIVTGYIYFMKENAVDAVKTSFSDGSDAIVNGKEELAKVRKCAPFCAP